MNKLKIHPFVKKNILPTFCITQLDGGSILKQLTVKQIKERLSYKQFNISDELEFSKNLDDDTIIEITLLNMCLKNSTSDRKMGFNVLINNGVLIGISLETEKTMNILGVEVPIEEVEGYETLNIKLKTYAFVDEGDLNNFNECEAYYSIGLVVSDLSKKLKLKCQKTIQE